MDHLSVEVAPDHIESLTKVRKPIVAIEELIWNSLDADATLVEVRLSENQIAGLDRVVIADNGHGIHREKWHAAFGTLGGSPKLKVSTTAAGRRVHGKAGRGRFRAFGLGKTVKWRSRYRADGKCLEFEIVGRLGTIQEFDATDPEPASVLDPGVVVEILYRFSGKWTNGRSR